MGAAAIVSAAFNVNKIQRKLTACMNAMNKAIDAADAYAKNPNPQTLANMVRRGGDVLAACTSLAKDIDPTNTVGEIASDAATIWSAGSKIYDDIDKISKDPNNPNNVALALDCGIQATRGGWAALKLIVLVTPEGEGAGAVVRLLNLVRRNRKFISTISEIGGQVSEGLGIYYSVTQQMEKSALAAQSAVVIGGSQTIVVTGHVFSYDLSSGMHLGTMFDSRGTSTDLSDDRSFTYVKDKNGKIISSFVVPYSAFDHTGETGGEDPSSQVITRSYYDANNVKLFDVQTSKTTGLMTVLVGGQPVVQNASAAKVEVQTVTVIENGTPVQRQAVVVGDPDSVNANAYVLGPNGTATGEIVPVPVEKLPNLIGSAPSSGSQGFNPDATSVKVGDIIGSSLGNYLAGGDALKGIVYSSVLGEIGQRIGGALQGTPQGVFSDNGKIVHDSVAESFASDVWQRMEGAATGTVSSMLAAQLAKSMGLTGFGGELFTTVVSSSTNAVLTQIESNLANGVGTFDNILGEGGINFGNVIGSAVTSFIGAKLASAIVQPQTQAAVLLSSIGSAVGSFLGGAVGSFFGQVLGTLIGNLFGRKKPRTPTATAETVLQLPYAQYAVGTVTSANGGSIDLVTGMASDARDILNNLIGEVTGEDDHALVSNVNGYGTTQIYGHSGSQLYVKVNGAQHNVDSADQAVEFGTLTAIRNTLVIGGDLFLKRAIANSTAQDLTALDGDLQTAKDYEFYLHNKASINAELEQAYPVSSDPGKQAQINNDEAFYAGAAKDLVDKVVASGIESLSSSELNTYNGNKDQYDRLVAMISAQNVANPWIVTLDRASELKLDQIQTSDFYGGLGGFMESLGMQEVGYENASIVQHGGGAVISVKTPGLTAGVFDVLSEELAGPDSNDIKDGRFSDLNNLWDVATYTPNGQWWGRGADLNGWYGNGNDVLYAVMSGPSNGQLVDQRSDWLPSQAGITYEASVLAAQHRGLGQAILEFYDANHNYISGVFLNGTATNYGAGGGDLNNFSPLSITATAPAGTAYRRLNLRLASDGESDPYAFFTHPFTRALTAGNDIENDHFQGLGINGSTWNTWTNTTTGSEYGVDLGGWSGSGNDSAWVHMYGTTSNQVIDLDSNWSDAVAGVTYQSSVYAAQHRGIAEVDEIYADINGNQLAWDYIGSGGRESGGWNGDLNNYNVISGTSTAPVGAVKKLTVLRLISNGQGDPYAFWTMPETRAVTDNTPNWEDAGHSVWVENMGAVGYNTSGSITSGNDLIDRSGSTSATTIDDLSTADVLVSDGYWYQDPYDDRASYWVDTSYWETQSVTGGDDIFLGGQGNDVLNGEEGNDWLDGGAGEDNLQGGNGNDILLGGNGNDHLEGGAGNDYLAGGAGNEWSGMGNWYGIWGGDGNDTLVGGAGVDDLWGGNGDDTFIVDEDGGSEWDWFDGGDGSDTVSYERFDIGMNVSINNRQDWGWISMGYGDGANNIENLTGSNHNDTLAGDWNNNVLKGLDGDDLLSGLDGNDTIEGGAGADTMDGGSGVNVLSYETSSTGVSVNLKTGDTAGGDAEDDVFANFQNLRGSKYNDDLTGNDGSNVIEGLGGDDWITATAGGTASYSMEYDPYLDDYVEVSTWTGGDVYDGGTGSDTVDYSSATSAISLYLGGYTSTSASSGYGYGGMAQGATYVSIENVVGSAYADYLSAGSGNQTFEGDAGNDSLAGGAGSDTYVFDRGDGVDNVYDNNADANVVSLGANIKGSDLWIGTAGGGSGWLQIGIRGTGDYINISGNFGTRYNNIIKTLDFNGASQVDISKIDFMPSGAGDGNDVVNGSSAYNDLLLGFNGNDTITGAGSSWESNGNVVIGGLGNDVIHTSTGDDQFVYDRGDGVDTITDDGGEDTLVFGSTVSADDVMYQVVGNDLYIGLKDPNDDSKTASQVADRIRVVNGGVQYLVHEADYYENEGWENDYDYTQPVNTIEYVMAGGTSVDLRKLDIAWTTVETWNYNYIYPIALDLDGDGLNLSPVSTSDIIAKTAQGGLSRVSWVGPTDGFLAVDRNGDGQINSLSEISFTQDKPGAKSDLEGLKTWDTNGDGLLDARDANFGKLLLWGDANQNGRSTPKELKTLAEAGIAAIDLNGTGTGYTSDLGVDSFVQNTLHFIRADGTSGDAYDVALARRVLGSDGLDAGAYQAEWGASNADGTLGRLVNDPVAAAKALRAQQKMAVMNGIGASYAEIKTEAQVDFSDTDAVDAKVAQRWAKKSLSEQTAWASGQLDSEPSDKVRRISSDQAWANTLNTADKAARDATAHAEQQAAAQPQAESANPSSPRSAGNRAHPDASAPAGGLALSITASEPVQDLAPVSTTSDAGPAQQPWWQGGPDNGDPASSSLSMLLSAMAPKSDAPATVSANDSGMTQQQLLLLQAMAGFGGTTGGSAAVWTHDDKGHVPTLAASSGLTSTQQSAAA